MQVAYDGSGGHLGSADTQKLTLSTVYGSATAASAGYITGVNALFGADVQLNAREILISVDGADEVEARGLSLGDTGDVQVRSVVGSSITDSITIVANGAEGSMGVFSLRADTTLQAKNIYIETKADNGYGVLVQNSTQTDEPPEIRSRLVIDAEDTEIYAPNGGGLMAFSNGYLEVNGNLKVTAINAIDVRGHSTVLVNQDKTGVVTLNGDVVFETPNQAPDGNDYNSGDKLDADVTVNLTEGSSWTGRAYQQYSVKNESDEWVLTDSVALEDDRDEHYGFVTGFKLNIENGGVWNMTGDSFVNTASVGQGGSIIVSEAVKLVNAGSVALNDGTISLEGAGDQQVNINTMSGTGGTVNIATAANEDGTFATPRIHIETVESTAESPTTLAMNYTGITADDLSDDAASDLEQLASQSLTLGESETVAQTRTVAEGDIRGAVTQTVDQSGAVTGTKEAANTKLTDFGSVNAMSFVQWRNEINHLTRRLGDIRNAQGDIGAWARVYGGESQWGGANEVEMDHTTIQVGGDYRINNHWIAGGAFSYTDSDANLTSGEADGDSYSLAAYATYMADGGSFLDLIARYGHLKNDITAGNMDLDTSSSAFSLSAEMGHTFRFLEDRAYVEPQFEFTYGFIAGDDATASNGVKIDQDDFQSFVTRVGLRAGYDFPEKKGSFYGMLSYSYDWLGDVDGTATKGTNFADLSEDLGGGWVTYGIGAQFMMGDSAYFYGELERTSGGDIDNPYLFSAGVRMVF